MNGVNRVTPMEYGRLLEPLLEQAAAYALSILRRRADAEDAVQQAALKGLERLDGYDAERSFKSWWFAVLKNCCFDILRDRATLKTSSIDASNTQAAQSAPTPACDTLAGALERLSQEHSEILRLRYYGGLSYREIAQSLSIPDGTVMSRLHLARKALAAIIHVEDL